MSDAWEVLDNDEVMYGVFDACGYTPEAMAIFQDREDAERYVQWLTVDAPDDLRMNIDLAICDVYVTGVAWNHTDPSPPSPPTVRELQEFVPSEPR